jgi:hypothetical protein
LFFIPGVIAFVVDFSTGAIYLPEAEPTFQEYGPPPEEAGPALSHQPPARQVLAESGLKRVLLDREKLSLPRIEQVVANHVGRPVALNDADARISRLPQLNRFANQCRQHQRNDGFGSPVTAFFAGLGRA